MSASTEIPSSCWSVFTSFRRRRCRIDLFIFKNQNLKHGGNGGKKSEGTEEFRGCNDDSTIAACPKIAGKVRNSPLDAFLRFLGLLPSVPSVFQVFWF